MSLRGVGLAFGVAFGFVLAWSKFVDYDVIHDMLLLRDPYVFLMMGTAVFTASIGYRALRLAGWRAAIDGQVVSWGTTAPTLDHVLGSVLFGVGWALAGTCPGPALAQLGSGHLATIFTLAGLFGGVALRGAVVRMRQAAPVVAPSTSVAGM